MIEGLHPYLKYADSGHGWLGSIPEHWAFLPNRAIFDEVKDRNHPSEPMLSVTITRGIVPQKSLLADSSKKDSSNINKAAYKLVQPGDIAYNKMRAWQGALGASTLRGIVSPAYVVMRPRTKTNSWFYHHLYRTPSFAKEAERWSYGITSDMWSLRPEHFKVIYSVVPPPEEQEAIVRFLQHANRKIDGFIRAKRKLIALLNEQKQAIIHRAVTRGDANVATKPSGILWLGDIPAHWDNPRLGCCLTRIEQGWSPVAAEGDIAERQWCVLTLSAVRRGVFNPAAIKPVSRSVEIPRHLEVRDGDLLLTRSNTRDRVGDVCLVSGVRSRTLLCDLIYRLSLRKDAFVPQFVLYQLLCPLGRCQIEKDARGSSGTMPKISQRHIKSWRLVLPPSNEQLLIVELIEKECRPIDIAITRTEREIALMQEYRIRLTADVVTGKLDVRDAAANLPSVDEEPDVAVVEGADEIEEAEDMEDAVV